MTPYQRIALTAIAVVAVAATAVGLTLGGGEASTERQTEVAARGAQVMPFDLDATTHRFTATDGGGVQTVIADNPEDTREIDAIRRHLREEAAAFTKGDYSDPASIHGADMPGLATLQAGAERIDVRYVERSDGAEVHFASEDPILVEALHDWFDAQVSDHGDHAQHG